MRRITARATVNLEGLHAGQQAQVDPEDPRVAALLETGFLVREEEADPVAAAGGREKPQELETGPGGKGAAPEAREPATAAHGAATAAVEE